MANRTTRFDWITPARFDWITPARFDWITPALIEEHKNKLTPEHVAILTGFAGGTNYGTMAENLNLNIGTVKSRLNRARSALHAIVHKDKSDGSAKEP